MRTITCLILLTLGLLATACQQQSRHAATQTVQAKPATSTWTHQTIRPTEYYLTGPQQARAPDGIFPKGTRLTVLHTSGSYSRIEAQNGEIAWISRDAIAPIED